jgi:ADP-heptose:LPS heptosyltransferase
MLVRFHDTKINLKYLQPFQILGTWSLSELASFAGIPKNRNESLKDVVLICPYGDDTKEWPPSSIAELAISLQTRLIIEGQIVTVLDCSGLYENQFASLPKGSKYVSNLSFPEALEVIAKHGMVIGANSGLLQIASLQEKDVLVLFPPLSKYNSTNKMPLGSFTKAFGKEYKCAECRQSASCSCMASITPLEVLDVVCSEFGQYVGSTLQSKNLLPQI